MSSLFSHLMAFEAEDWSLQSFGDTMMHAGGLILVISLP